MDEQYIKKWTKDIGYVNVKPPVFQIPNYDIKAGKYV